MIKVKRVASGSKTYAGMELNQNDEYTIPNTELNQWGSDENAISDAVSGDLEVYDHSGLKLPQGSQSIDAIKDLLPKKIQQTMGSGGDYSMRPRGFAGIADPNSTTDIDYLVTETLSFRGGVMFSPDANMGDSVNMFVVDKDNILGFGADTVLSQYVQNWQVMPNQRNEVQDVDLSQPLIAGLYFRLSYTNTGASSVNVLLNLYAYVQS